MTFIQVINAVLRQLRENQANSVIENDYTQLIGQFVDQVKEEMEDQWDWTRYLRAVEGTIFAGDVALDLTESNLDNLNRAVNSRSKLAYDENDTAMVYDVTADQNNGVLRERNRRFFNRRYSVDTRPVGAPSEFAVEQSDSNGWTMRFNTETDIDRMIRSYWYIPQDSLSVTDNSDDGTEILLPTRPLIAGTLYYALNERGEEIGEPGGVAERRYINALASAIENDDSEKQSYLYRYFSNHESSRNTVYRGPGTSYGVS